MNPIQLHTATGKPLDFWICGECKRLSLASPAEFLNNRGNTGKHTREAAEKCCLPPDCSYCGQPVPKNERGHYSTYHLQCQRDHFRQQEIVRLEKAELVEYDGGWVFSDDLVGNKDGFFESMEDLLDYIGDLDEEGEANCPEFVFLCKPQSHHLDVGRILEQACDDGYEDMGSNLAGEKELEAAIEAFNKLNEQALTSYHPDYKRKVRVPR